MKCNAILWTMKKSGYIAYLLASAFAASFVPYLAVEFFDVPFIHGIVCWDVLFLLVVLCAPKFSKGFFVGGILLIGAYAVCNFTVSGVVLTIYYALLWMLGFFLPRKKIPLIASFVFFSLVSFVADASVFFYNGFRLYLVDVWNLASFFWWGVLLFIFVPCLWMLMVYFFARKMMWVDRKFYPSPLKCCVILVAFLLAHLGVGTLQDRQSLLSFPIRDAVNQMFLKGTESKNVLLQQDAKDAFEIWKRNEPVVSLDKPTLQILVESWGVKKDVSLAKSFFEPYRFENATFMGLFLRESAYTQGAEWEDFGIDDGDNIQESVPAQFKEHGFQTWYVHGYDGDFYRRHDKYGAYGFDSLVFKDEFIQKGLSQCEYGFTGICDSSIALFLDSLMTDSVPKYIYWTTLDSHPPYEKSLAGSRCGQEDEGVECIFRELQLNTAAIIAKLAKKHPEYRVVIRGDHRPMGSLGPGFVSSFYYRWVPMVVFH